MAASTREPAPGPTGRAPASTATAITTAALAIRAVQTGQKTPEEPAFRRHTKKMPNMAPHTVPYTRPRSAG